MNWVAPIKDDETLRRYEEELLNLDVKYFIMFRIGVGTGMQVQDILKLTVGDVRDKDSIVVYLGTHKVKRSFRFEADLKKIDQSVRAKLRFVPTDHVDKVLDVALMRRENEEKKTAAAPLPPVKAERSGVRQ